MSRRIMGRASFGEIQDSKGRIQIYLNRDEICTGEDKTTYNTVFKKLLDIGDFIGIKGNVFTTKVGEISVRVKELTLLTKSLRPLPLPKADVDGNIHDSFTDPEKRYRQRYVDLVVNPNVKDTFIKRTQLTNSMRSYLNEKGYLEVETPILQPLYGGAAARPFKTYHKTLDMELYLRIANELYLKRLVVGGFDGVYEFSKDFRNEGMSRFHNPEFTQMELYVAYKDYFWMMDLVEEMVEKIAIDLNQSTKVKLGDKSIDFKISDTGIGMTPDQVDKVFKPFTQADEKTTRKFGGTGLGLTITKMFAEMMGGDINLSSKEGKGTTFTATIPLEVIDVKKKNEAELITMTTGKDTDYTVLVIDDDDNAQDMMKKFLEKQNVSIIQAKSGEEGLKLAAEHLPDAITLDVMMPEMDGWEVLTVLQANDVTKNIKKHANNNNRHHQHEHHTHPPVCSRCVKRG